MLINALFVSDKKKEWTNLFVGAMSKNSSLVQKMLSWLAFSAWDVSIAPTCVIGDGVVQRGDRAGDQWKDVESVGHEVDLKKQQIKNKMSAN